MDSEVSHPSHYAWLKEVAGIEVLDITRHMDFDLGCAVKYILRAGRKVAPGQTERQAMIQDLKKAVFYIKDKIAMLEEEEEAERPTPAPTAAYPRNS